MMTMAAAMPMMASAPATMNHIAEGRISFAEIGVGGAPGAAAG